MNASAIERTSKRGHEHLNMTLNNLVRSVRQTGTLGLVGGFVKEHPRAAVSKKPEPRLREEI